MTHKNFLCNLLAVAMTIPVMAILLASSTAVVNPVTDQREPTVLAEENKIARANTEAQLRLLNQTYPQGDIAAGKTVKTIQ